MSERERTSTARAGAPSSAPGSVYGAPSSLWRFADVLDTVIDRIGRWAAWCGLALVLLVAIDVILRYLFRIGSVAMQELEWHLISPIALIGMSYALCHNEHVRVDLFYERLRPHTRLVIELASAIVTVVISVVMVYLSLGFVEQAYTSGESSTDPGGLPYRFLLKAFIPLGFALLFAQAVAHAIHSGLKLIEGRTDG